MPVDFTEVESQMILGITMSPIAMTKTIAKNCVLLNLIFFGMIKSPVA